MMRVSQPNGSIDGYTLPIAGRCMCTYVCKIMTTSIHKFVCVIVRSSLIRTIVYRDDYIIVFSMA